jgi:hypothetical protein
MAGPSISLQWLLRVQDQSPTERVAAVAGFEILRTLRERSGRDFHPLHMEAGRIPFEQESLGRPTRKTWPFYG